MTLRTSILIVLLALVGCSDITQVMTNEEIAKAVAECHKFGLQVAPRLNYRGQVSTINCLPHT